MNIRSNNTTANATENGSEDGNSRNSSPAKIQKLNPFYKILIVMVFTGVVLILLIAGTATTAISYPPKPPQFSEFGTETEAETALDGDYKLIGPLLLTSGLFMMVVTTILCVIVTRDAYISSRCMTTPTDNIFTSAGALSVLGGPFFLATPIPPVKSTRNKEQFSLTRELWAIPNVPSSEFVSEDNVEGSKPKPASAKLLRCNQPPYNPDIQLIEDE